MMSGMMMTLSVVITTLSLLCATATATTSAPRDTVEVIFPVDVAQRFEVVRAHPALFGAFFYGREQSGPAYLANDNDEHWACHKMTNPSSDLPTSEAFEPYIMVARRRNCSFVHKAIEAQKAGASALLVVNSEAKQVYMGVDRDEYALSAEVGIPVLIIDQVKGEMLIKALEATAKSGDSDPQKLRLALKVSLPIASASAGSPIDVRFYSRVVDDLAISLKQNFGQVVQTLGSSINFSPHYILSPRGPSSSDDACLGRYCDASRQQVEETLRQLCVHKEFSASTAHIWWIYVAKFQKECIDKSSITISCSHQVMSDIGIDASQVERCVTQSQDPSDPDANVLLQSQMDDPRNLHYTPMLIANEAIFESSLRCVSPVTLESCPPLKFFCMMFENESKPDACMTSSSCGLGQVVDACGTCRAVNAADFISNVEECVASATPLPASDNGISTLLMLLCVFGVIAAAGFVHMIQRKRRHMRQEINRIMADYTELDDGEGVEGLHDRHDYSYAGVKPDHDDGMQDIPFAA